MTEKYFIEWKVALSELAVAAKNGCQFCGLIACEFFVGNNHFEIYTMDDNLNPLGCCAFGTIPDSPPSENLKKSINRLEGLIKKHADAQFTFLTQPKDWDESSRSFCKLQFLATDTNLEQEIVEEILGHRSEIIIESYGIEGLLMTHSKINMKVY